MKKININPTDFCACILATEMPEACFFWGKKAPNKQYLGLEIYFYLYTLYAFFLYFSSGNERRIFVLSNFLTFKVPKLESQGLL